MTRLTYPRPATLHLENLTTEIAAAIGAGVAVEPYTDHIDVIVPDGTAEPAVAAAVAAHTGAPTTAQTAAVTEAEAANVFGDFTPVQLAKIRDVYAGNSAFTVAQRDKLLAGLALLVHRRLR